MNRILSIELFSDLNYEGMVINITCDKETIASVNYEKGVDNMEIEITPMSQEFKFLMDDFLLALEKAKKLAFKCAKEDEDFRKKGIDF